MDNPIKILSNLFNKGGGGVLGVDIGSSSIKIVQLKKQGGQAVLETYGELALGPYGGAEVGNSVKLTTTKMAEAVTDILREAKATTKSCGIAIPISSSMVTMIEMPLVDQKQLASMVPIEARKYVPVPISEVLMDWWVIPKEEAGLSMPFGDENQPKDMQGGRMVDVLLAVIHNEAVNKYQEVAKGALLDSSFYEIEIFSTIRAVAGPEPEPVMILDMGATTTKLYIVERGIVRGSHMINRGSLDITLALSRALNITVKEAEAMKRNGSIEEGAKQKVFADLASTTLYYIFSEVNRIIINYEKKNNKRLGKIILTGGGALLGGLLPFARNYLEAEAFLADPFARVGAPAFMQNILAEAGPEFAVAIGLALRKIQEG